MSIKGALTALLVAMAAVAISLISLTSAGDTTRFEIDILGPDPAPPAVIGVQVPSSIYLGEIKSGEKTDDVRIDINNTGNTAIIVTPLLYGAHDEVFENVYFRRRTTEAYYSIGDYGHNISAPSATGNGVRSDYMYVKIDLRDYEGNFDENTTTRLDSDVKFFAIAQ